VPNNGDDKVRIEELEADLKDLRQAVDRQRRLARQAAGETREQAARNRDLRKRLGRITTELESLRKRRSVRMGLAIARPWRALVRVFRRGGSIVAKRPARVATRRPSTLAQEREFVARARALTAQMHPPVRGPLVSIVILNRNGASHLDRCLPALAATAYEDVELIVIDNASTDASLAALEAFRPSFPVRVIRNAENATFSDGNNQGIAQSQGEYVLFLNNDIEPLGPEWLGFLIETATEPSVVAVGARLIYPRREEDPVAGAQFQDLSLQHGGVGFRMVDGVPLPTPLGAGTDPLDAWATEVREAPALTAACLLVHRSALEEVGGFTSGYVYGHEDVDLSLKLRDQGGRLVYDGRSALWHHESSTRNRDDWEARRTRTIENRERFVGTWGPRLYRTVMADALEGTGFWRSDPFHLGFIGTPDPASTAPAPTLSTLSGRGWRISGSWHVEPTDDGAPDAVIVYDPDVDVRELPGGPIRIAWISGGVDRWLSGPGIDDFDIVIVPDEAAAEAIRQNTRKVGQLQPIEPDAASIAAIVQSWLDRRRVGIRIPVPTWDVAASWGDLHFARDVQRAMERLGHPARIHLRPAWDAWPAARDDVGLQLMGREVASPRSGRLEVLWHISHPDDASVEIYEAHDLVFVASDSFAAWMNGRVSVPVLALHQAADPERFRPGVIGPLHELLFVANSRGVRRHVLQDLLPTIHELAVYGRGWTPERLDPRYVAGESVPNERLAGYYGSAAIVLNDHWPDMQREGFMSNRLFDAAAAGGFVISDDIEGLEAEFDHGVVAYHGPDELHELIEHFLKDPADRAEYAARARAAVLTRHTFELRIREFFRLVDPLMADRPATFRDQLSTPSAEPMVR
jgi:GT2 family glycosyltransferase